MPRGLGAAAMSRPLVSPAEVRRFDKAVTVRDKGAFVYELDRLVREKLAVAATAGAAGAPTATSLRRKADALRAPSSWEPSVADIQRGRAELIREFEQSHNLPLADFARLAHKSRQQIYKDIAARRLLALDVGRRGQRLPDWQLEAAGLQLTRAVLDVAEGVDAWTVYHALGASSDALGGRSPVAVVKRGNIEATTQVVLDALGLQEAERIGAAA